MEALRTTYIQALPEKIRRVQCAWRALEADRWDEEAYNVVYHMIHNLAGGAGTYGFTEISLQARNTLQLMKPWLDAGAGPGEGAQLQITRHIEALS